MRPYLRGEKEIYELPLHERDTAPWVLTGGTGPREYCLCASKQGRSGFPGGPGLKSVPCDAGGRWFDPWSGKISHAAGRLTPCITTTEACTP